MTLYYRFYSFFTIKFLTQTEETEVDEAHTAELGIETVKCEYACASNVKSGASKE